MVKCRLTVAFKAYQQHQALLLPPSIDKLISPSHPVRVVNRCTLLLSTVCRIAKLFPD